MHTGFRRIDAADPADLVNSSTVQDLKIGVLDEIVDRRPFSVAIEPDTIDIGE